MQEKTALTSKIDHPSRTHWRQDSLSSLTRTTTGQGYCEEIDQRHLREQAFFSSTLSPPRLPHTWALFPSALINVYSTLRPEHALSSLA